MVPDPQNYIVILRFLGTSPMTSSINNTFLSILYQLERIFDLKISDKNFANTNDLRDYLHKTILTLAKTNPEKRIVFFLDSIDQLISTDYDLTWFIGEFPKNIKFIYSTLTNHGGILDLLKRHFLPGDEHYSQVDGLKKHNVLEMFRQWLKDANRTLTQVQWEKVEVLLDSATLYPLYLKLIFDLLVKWPSYVVPENFMKILTIDDSINYLFDRLAKDHGKKLFTKILAYLSLFENAISENMLEDILSVDDEVLYEIFEFHAPPVRRYDTFKIKNNFSKPSV